ncbi:unnamed protein product [Hermetia illucens]|uniref:Phorbol-ester/DAG-type domain-containing protein n=1 Tax=Hermetia illucens TaxID=343691 RepID=A0A7R8V157_HERIL|nr:run domain Beclin-1-interacting and cysteine-rich domain-containing protein isoform X2 [Hermetia illucens]CAD7090976.1 unnamed protein product [Hermetia illucens]
MQSEKCLPPPVSIDHRQLLYELKKSVDLWFLSRRDCLDESMDDGERFFQVLLSIKNILTDGLYKKSDVEGETTTSDLITQLNWLTPSINTEEKMSCFPPLQLKDPLALWIYTNFQNATLCARLQLFVADLELLTSFYGDEAFLNNDRYATALFICLSAIELNQSSLTSQIDGSLYATHNLVIPKHKRSNSHPHFSISPTKASQISLSRVDSIDSSTEPTQPRKPLNVQYRLREWKSLPNIRTSVPYKRTRSKTFSQATCSHDYASRDVNVPSFPLTPIQSVPSCSYQTPSQRNLTAPSTSKGLTTEELVPINLVKCDDIKIYFDQGHDHDRKASPDERPDLIEYDSPPKPLGPIHFLSCISTNLFSLTDTLPKDATASASSSFSNSNDFMSVFLPQEGKKLKRFSHSLFEDRDDNLHSILDKRLPANGQNLSQFLHSVQFSHNNTDLERENAHFSMSEAMICLLEKMKCSKVERKKQPIKRSDPQKCTRSRAAGGSNCAHETMGSSSKSQSSVGRSVSSFSEMEDSQEDSDMLTDGSIDGHSDDLTKDVTQTNQSSNDHTAYAEWGGENTLEALSAEGVALSLISRFSDYQLPRASDITWLVSHKDAPQDLLPLPRGSPSTDPDETYVPPVIRGTRDWAPPRQQIIFTDHPNPNRKQVLQQQNNRCTGCGMRVYRAYVNRFRYCTYLGKYHCTGCHRNQMSIIPAKVLEKWDFCYYPVSVFAYRLLEQIWTYPLFYVPDLNPSLYVKIRNLSISRLKRVQLKYIQDFIITCRFAVEEKKLFDNIAAYVTLEPDKWSMFDFVAVKDGSFPKTVTSFILKCEEHIFNCELCTARGFICEICPKKQVIFPWQAKVKRCDNCGTCFHQKCWENVADCMKCQRLRSRKQKFS